MRKARTEGSATLKSKVFGAKKAKEKQENVTGFSEERKRKGKVKNGKKQIYGYCHRKISGNFKKGERKE